MRGKGAEEWEKISAHFKGQIVFSFPFPAGTVGSFFFFFESIGIWSWGQDHWE